MRQYSPADTGVDTVDVTVFVMVLARVEVSESRELKKEADAVVERASESSVQASMFASLKAEDAGDRSWF